MFYNYYQDYEYDSCVSRGICSIEPRSASLQEVVIMYLKQLAYYVLKLYQIGVTNANIKENIINTLSGLATSPNYTNEQFQEIIYTLSKELSNAMKLYTKLCKEKNQKPEFIKSNIKPNEIFDITKSIRQGEKEFQKKSKSGNFTQKSLYEVIFILIKSICINLTTLKSYEKDDEKAYISVLKLLNTLNKTKTSNEELTKEIEHFSEVDFRLQKRINELQSYEFGRQKESEVSYSTRVGKAILVAGENIKELELVLEATKGKGIDVYTHGEMILAYTYPKFKEYENLRGQFGTGIDNCLLDFATFPGAILVTKHALENIEYLYRGRLFTTEKYNPKGVIKIEDNNFEPLIKSSMEAKGFKTGKERPKIKIGYNDLELETLFSNLLKEKNQYKNVFIMGAGTYTVEQKLYFEKIINLLPQDVFLISLTYPTKTKNSVYINATGDFYFLYKSTDFIRKFLPESKITIFLGKYDKHTLSNIIKLKKNNADNIFMSKCSPMIMNPRVMNILNSTFKIKQITNANQDLNLILDNT